MSCILTCYWKLQSQICTYYATLYFASVTMGCLGLSCLQIFANFAAELCCRPELFWSQLTLTIIYIFLLFQTGVPHYEDFISKAGKLHSHLKWVVQYQPRLLTGFCDHLSDQSLMLSTTQALSVHHQNLCEHFIWNFQYSAQDHFQQFMSHSVWILGYWRG